MVEIWIGVRAFEVGEFPKMGVEDAGRPLSDEKAAASFGNKSDKAPRGRPWARVEVGEICNATGTEGEAVSAHRAEIALWLSRSADQRAELHKRLVQVRAGSLTIVAKISRSADELFSEFPESVPGGLLSGILLDSKQATEDANDIAIENRRGLIERDAANRSGGVAADAGQFENVVECSRKSSPMLADEKLRGLLQIAGACVIAQAFPKFQDAFRGCAGQRPNRRQLTHPAFPIWNHGFHLCLLEHDLGNPDCVRIARATPWKVAGVPGKPGEQ